MIDKLALGLLMGVSSTFAFAQTDIQAPQNNGYNQDSRGAVTRSGFGLCWRSGSWTATDAVAGCDGALKPPIPNPIAPEVKNILASEAVDKPCDFAVTLESGETFASGQAILNAKAKKRLADTVLPQLAKCQSIADMTITGHTDNIGAAEANRHLSEKRAASVAGFLKSHGVTTPINIHGAGETQPLLNCHAGMSRTRLISCLAPNRRVQIQVHGTQK
ncbi:MAG TPA: OmpA family protein [Oxalicibacterium sp.]